MKIPFTNYHIVNERVLVEKNEEQVKLDALLSLTSDSIPEIEQLLIALREEKVGHSARGRRRAKRKVLRCARELKVMMEEAA